MDWVQKRKVGQIGFRGKGWEDLVQRREVGQIGFREEGWDELGLEERSFTSKIKTRGATRSQSCTSKIKTEGVTR